MSPETVVEMVGFVGMLLGLFLGFRKTVESKKAEKEDVEEE